MPTLDWIGKKAVVNHQRDVPYRLIHCDKDKSVGDPDAGNLMVQGDNLEAWDQTFSSVGKGLFVLCPQLQLNLSGSTRRSNLAVAAGRSAARPVS